MIELKITLQDDGQVLVHGPIKDKLLCYGLFEMAKEIISNYEETNLVIPQMKLAGRHGH